MTPLVALLYIHDTWMSIERHRVAGFNPQPPASGRQDSAAEDFDDVYDDISRSDDVSEAVHAPTYRVREDRGEAVRGSDRLTVSYTFCSWPRKVCGTVSLLKFQNDYDILKFSRYLFLKFQNDYDILKFFAVHL